MINVVQLVGCCRQFHLNIAWSSSYLVNLVRTCCSHESRNLCWMSLWQSTPLLLKSQLFFSFITVRPGARHSCCSSWVSAYGMGVGFISKSSVESVSLMVLHFLLLALTTRRRFERELEALRKEINESARTNGTDSSTDISRTGSLSDLSSILSQEVNGSSSSESSDNGLQPESRKSQ
jgi:hypothetical protein